MFQDRFTTEPGGRGNNQRWLRHPGNPILKPTPASWTSEWIANETIIRLGDKYVMYLDGKADDPAERIGVAVADASHFDGVTWKEFDHNPVLEIGPAGYDRAGVLDPAVLSYRDRLWMYYTGLSGPPDRLCLAWSEDGFQWTKHDGNPILHGRCPHAVTVGDKLYLFYLVYNEDGGYDVRLATSEDGIRFEKHDRKPILPRGAEGEWDSFSIVTTRIFKEDRTYNMLYAGDAERVDEPRGFGLAVSTDLVNWEKFPGNPIFLPGETGSWDCEAIWCPWVMKREDEYWMWYCGSRTTYSQGLTPQTGLAILR